MALLFGLHYLQINVEIKFVRQTFRVILETEYALLLNYIARCSLRENKLMETVYRINLSSVYEV